MNELNEKRFLDKFGDRPGLAIKILSALDSPSFYLLNTIYESMVKLGHEEKTIVNVMNSHDFPWTEEFQDFWLRVDVSRWVSIPSEQLHPKYYYLRSLGRAGILR